MQIIHTAVPYHPHLLSLYFSLSLLLFLSLQLPLSLQPPLFLFPPPVLGLLGLPLSPLTLFPRLLCTPLQLPPLCLLQSLTSFLQLCIPSHQVGFELILE